MVWFSSPTRIPRSIRHSTESWSVHNEGHPGKGAIMSESRTFHSVRWRGLRLALLTSLPGVVVLGSGNSPMSQRIAAGTDLVLGFDIGGLAPNALTGTAKALN